MNTQLDRTVRQNGRLIYRIFLVIMLVACAYRIIHYVTVERPLLGLGGGNSSKPAKLERAVLISVDGLRPDLLLRGNTPNIKWMMARGAYTMWARTTDLAITLPSHTSMSTGVRPEHHRIFWNEYIEDAYPDYPTFLELGHQVGYSTALAAGKTKFHELARPGKVDWVEVYKNGSGTDMEVAQSASDIIRRHRPELMFIHLAVVDSTGHALGWGSPDQMEAIARADQAVGHILDTLRQQSALDSTMIILSADHGGQGRGHGAGDMRSRHIPWIAMGPGIRKNYDLTRDAGLQVNTEDSFSTICAMMNIPVRHQVDGKFVNQILQESELVKNVSDKKDDKPFERWWLPPEYKYEPTPIPSHHN